MASNGFVFRPGRGPSFIFVGLVVIVIVLFYSYWGVSSKNNKLLRDVSVLQDRLRVLAARKLTSDKKSSALVTQLTQMQDDKEKIEGVIKSRDSEITDSKNLLKMKEDELRKLYAQEKIYQEELEKLRKGVNSSSSELKLLKVKAVELMKKHAELKANHSFLLDKISKLTEERDGLKEDLLRVRLELEEAKKAQAVTAAPRVTRKISRTTSKVKTASERESVEKAVEKGSEKLEQDEKVSVESKSKTSVVDEEKDDDKNTELSEEKESKEIKPTPSMVKGNFSQENMKTSSSSVNISSEGQDASKLKPTTRSTALMSKDVPEEEEGEKEYTPKEDESDDEEIANQPRKRDVEDAESKEKEIKETGKVNDEDKEDDDDNGDEALDEEEKVRESMDSPVGGKVPLQPLPKDTFQRTEGKMEIPDEVRKLQNNNNMVGRRMDPHAMSRDTSIELERARRVGKDHNPGEEELPRDLI